MKIAITPKRVFQCAQLSNALQDQGHQVDIYSSATYKYFKARGFQDGPKLHFSPLPFAILEKLRLGRYGKKGDYFDSVFYDYVTSEMIGGHDILFAWTSCCLKTIRKAKSVGMGVIIDRSSAHVQVLEDLLRSEADKHGLTFRPQPSWFVERQLEEYSTTDLIICPSHYTADSFPAALRAKTRVAPLPLGRRFVPPFEKKPNGKSFRVCTVGGDPLRKGYFYLLQAWRKLNLPDATLLIRCGGGGAQQWLIDQASSCHNVEIVGYVPDIDEFYKSCDAFILPSIEDGFGMAPIEAMAQGTPCIVTANCGMSEMVMNGRDAIVIPSFDTDAITCAILKLYEDRQLRDGIGEMGHKLVQDWLAKGGQNPYSTAIAAMIQELS